MILDLTVLPDITSFNGGMYYHPDFMLHISYLTVITIFLSAALIIIRHKSNINRIKKGAEPATHFQNTIDGEKKEA
jgi:glycerol-3-phosphate acyltransferase PlsY